jgi:hypothetical protein
LVLLLLAARSGVGMTFAVRLLGNLVMLEKGEEKPENYVSTRNISELRESGCKLLTDW